MLSVFPIHFPFPIFSYFLFSSSLAPCFLLAPYASAVCHAQLCLFSAMPILNRLIANRFIAYFVILLHPTLSCLLFVQRQTVSVSDPPYALHAHTA